MVHYLEGLRAVKGEGEYIHDLPSPPGTLYMAIYRSYMPHGRIKRMDVSDVVRKGGIAYTNEDVLKLVRTPFPLALPVKVEYYPVAKGKVRFVGEPLAVVLADDPYRAVDLLEYVNAEIEELPPVTNAQEALKGKALVHEELGTNVVMRRHMEFGDVERAFKDCDVVVRKDFKVAKHSALPLETYGIITKFGEELDVVANVQGPMLQVYYVAKALGLPESKVRIRSPRDIGGSFGVKYSLYPYIVLTAVASKLSGRPVRWTESRTESFLASSSNADREGYVELGSTRDGRIRAVKYNFLEDVGAYPRPPEPGALFRVQGNLNGAYDVRNIEAEYTAVVTNKSPTGLNRGYGSPQFYFALETAVDELAKELGLDPLELRKRNLITSFDKVVQGYPFYETATGGLYPKQDYAKVVQLLEEEYKRARREEGMGVGVSIIVEPSVTNLGYVDLAVEGEKRRHKHSPSGEYVTLSLNYDGSLSVFVNSTNEGLGHETVMAEVVAREFHVDPSQVKVEYRVDTSHPWALSSGSYSSRFAPVVVSGVIKACDALKERLADLAKRHLEGEVKFVEGKFVDEKGRSVDLKTLASSFHWDPYSSPGNLTVTVFYHSDLLYPAEGDKVNSSLGYSIQGHLAVVKVDPLTHDVKVKRYVVIHDVGKVLKEELLDGVMYGSVLHGLAEALYERLDYDPNGNPLVTTFDAYETPTLADVIGMEVTLKHLESEVKFLPSGALGAGEGPIMGVLATLANAVSDALKRRINRVPMR
jgi:2-furoyl-CoA dehydrogenase large subunit